MKKIGVLAVASLLSVGAMAADNTIGLTARMSWKSTDNDYTKTGTPNQSVITAEFAKVNFGGTLNSSTKYYMLWNLTQASLTDATNHQDGTNKFVEKVGIVRTLGEGLTLDLGKQAIIAGGMELTHSSADQYAQSNFSQTGNDLSKEFGANLGYTVSGQSFNLQLTNGNATAKATAGQSKYGYAATWAGTFGSVGTKVGYTVRPTGVGTAGDRSLLGAGLSFKLPEFVVEADYGLDTTKKGSATTADAKTNSMVLVAAYTGHENFTPFAKYFSDVYKTNANGSKFKTVDAFGLGVEYKEAKADPIRYHAVYTSAATKYEAAGSLVSPNTKATVSTIFVGAKFVTSLL